MSNPVIWENEKYIISLSSAELAHRMLKVILSILEICARFCINCDNETSPDKKDLFISMLK